MSIDPYSDNINNTIDNRKNSLPLLHNHSRSLKVKAIDDENYITEGS